MPWENIGSVGAGQMPQDEAWILFCYDLAISYLKFSCGAPPPGSELGVMWHEHELGEYPSLGIYYEYEPPWEFIHHCESALERFDSAISWTDIQPQEELEDDFEDEDSNAPDEDVTVRKFNDVFPDDDGAIHEHCSRLGWEFFVYRFSDAASLGSDSDQEHRARLARWESALGGIDWIMELVEQGIARQQSGEGYPSSYLIPVGVLCDKVRNGPPGGKGPVVVGDNYFTPSGWIGRVNIDFEKLTALDRGEQLLIQAWDQS